MIKRIGVFSVFLFFTTIGQLQATFSFEENEALPIVYFNIVVNAGSANDPKDKLGLTNMTYQMLLRGTQKRSKVEFDEALDNIGGRLGVDVRTEGTVFRGAVLSENLKPFLDLVYEALTSPRFAAVETAKIKKEIEKPIKI
ncbi:MAG TPA: insulinase family protein [Oligoflexia bacterium]|nr:insulinase family protein [Oligoflexia bacterium]